MLHDSPSLKKFVLKEGAKVILIKNNAGGLYNGFINFNMTSPKSYILMEN